MLAQMDPTSYGSMNNVDSSQLCMIRMLAQLKGNANLTELGNDSIHDEMRILLNWGSCALLCLPRNHCHTCGSVYAHILVGEHPGVTHMSPRGVLRPMQKQ